MLTSIARHGLIAALLILAATPWYSAALFVLFLSVCLIQEEEGTPLRQHLPKLAFLSVFPGLILFQHWFVISTLLAMAAFFAVAGAIYDHRQGNENSLVSLTKNLKGVKAFVGIRRTMVIGVAETRV
ncbi:hypothetical protein ACKC9G_05505 [Pokkaliibacter sp. CJK22405]|uniref:hypothetical protein n=1 Tax=Pokkaliibacter sp. CJK22405 TaxID=3384615 RepID=UPI003984D21E